MRKKIVKTETTDSSLKIRITEKRNYLKNSYTIAATNYVKSSKKQDRDLALQIKAKLDVCNELLS
jgi:hypothetical protein